MIGIVACAATAGPSNSCVACLQAFVAYAGPTVLFSSLSVHTQPELTAMLLDLIWRSARSGEDMSAECIELGAIPTALSLLKNKSTSWEVQATAANLLAELCRGKPDTQRLLRKAQVCLQPWLHVWSF